jgi:predicted metal-binding membrane protein
VLKALLQRERWIVLACLAVICLSGWWYLVSLKGSGMAMDGGMAMEGTMDMAGMEGMPMPAPSLTASFGATFLMWFIMMVAMMIPSAAPMILLYERFAGGARAAGGALLPTGLFAALYLAVWAGFSLLATAAQLILSHVGVVDAASLAIGDRRLAGALLIAAALYQLTPAKRACLDNCRSPLSFLQREWGPGWSSAVRLGLKHGAYCVGCCWLLMTLLFVGGVMNLAWIAVLAVIVLAEKVAPAPEFTRYAIAAAAGAGGVYLLIG